MEDIDVITIGSDDEFTDYSRYFRRTNRQLSNEGNEIARPRCNCRRRSTPKSDPGAGGSHGARGTLISFKLKRMQQIVDLFSKHMDEARDGVIKNLFEDFVVVSDFQQVESQVEFYKELYEIAEERLKDLQVAYQNRGKVLDEVMEEYLAQGEAIREMNRVYHKAAVSVGNENKKLEDEASGLKMKLNLD